MNLVNDWTDVNSKIKLIQMLILRSKHGTYSVGRIKVWGLINRQGQSSKKDQKKGQSSKKDQKKGQQVKFEIQNIFDNYIKMKQRLVLKVCVMVKLRNNCKTIMLRPLQTLLFL